MSPFFPTRTYCKHVFIPSALSRNYCGMQGDLPRHGAARSTATPHLATLESTTCEPVHCPDQKVPKDTRHHPYYNKSDIKDPHPAHLQQGNSNLFAQWERMPSTRASEAALGRAIQAGDDALVATLLTKGVDIEASVKCLDGTSVSPLMLAACCGHTFCAALLLRAGAKPDRRFGEFKETALITCASNGDKETALALIDAGASLRQVDTLGRSPLFMSCLMSQPSCTELLLEADADVEQEMASVNPGATPLFAAALGTGCECCSIRCAMLLCDAGAIVDAQTAEGATPMMAACIHGHRQLAMLLSSYGASRRVARFEGNLPTTWWARDLAEKGGHDELVTWLDASDDFTPLHHIEVLLPRRTLSLLRSGAASPVAGHPSAALRAKNFLTSHPLDEAAKMIVCASEPWSPTTHNLWGAPQRTRVLQLLKIGYLLQAKLAHGAVLDWWVAHVMPDAVEWELVEKLTKPGAIQNSEEPQPDEPVSTPRKRCARHQ